LVNRLRIKSCHSKDRGPDDIIHGVRPDETKVGIMANPPVTVRLRPVMIAYLEELGRIGPYGKGKGWRDPPVR
jgi:hypothetical protein